MPYVLQTGNEVGRKLENLAQGSRIGLALDYRQCLRLFINGEDQGGVIRLAVPFPVYPFYELIGPYRKVGVTGSSQCVCTLPGIPPEAV